LDQDLQKHFWRPLLSDDDNEIPRLVRAARHLQVPRRNNQTTDFLWSAQSGFAEVGCPEAQQRFDRPGATSTQSGFAEVGCPEAGDVWIKTCKNSFCGPCSQMMPTRRVVGAALLSDPSNETRVCIPNRVSDIWIKISENKFWPLQLSDDANETPCRLG
jgi:hypothetical protein